MYLFKISIRNVMYDICSGLGLGLGFYIFRGVEHEMAYSKRSEIKI
jgi:hypothetical protein